MRAAVLSICFCFCLSLGYPFLASLQAQQGDVQAGAKLHEAQCLRCHGAEGRGDGPAAKLLKPRPADWTDAKRMAALSDEDLIKVVKEGGKAAGISAQMPEFGSRLSDTQVRDLIAFIKSKRK